MAAQIQIGKIFVGNRNPCFIIAEAGVNHNGQVEMANQMIEIAGRVGANAVKFQTFNAELLSSPSAPKAGYQKLACGETETQLEMLKRLELPRSCYGKLTELCKQFDLQFMSSPFDAASARFLDALGMEVFKIPSGEITNIEFIESVGRLGKPVILSTGMSTMGEIESAVKTLERVGNRQRILLHCVSNYPAAPADMNLRAMETLSKNFGVPVGLSDHSQGIEVALAAVALGACIVEKHFTLDPDLPGPDHSASLDPMELESLVKGIRKVEAALGDGVKRPTRSEGNTARAARRSLVAASHVRAGALLTAGMLTSLRPGTGLAPSRKNELIGKRARVDIPAGTVVSLEMFE